MCICIQKCGGLAAWCRAKQEWYQLFIIKIVLTGMLNISMLENRKLLPLCCNVKSLTTFSHVPFLVGQPRLPHSWLCELGSTRGIPTGTAGCTQHPHLPRALMVLGLISLVCPAQRSCTKDVKLAVKKAEERKWVWETKSSSRVSMNLAWWTKGELGQEREGGVSLVWEGWLITRTKIRERQKWGEKKILLKEKEAIEEIISRKHRWSKRLVGTEMEGGGKREPEKREIGRRWW